MGRYKLNTEQIKDMMNRLAQGESKYQVANDFKVSRKTVYNLIEKVKNSPEKGIDWEEIRKDYK